MPKRTDFQERRDRVLGIVVDQYVKTVTPVSSAYIAHESRLDLSSATIRNILAELEEDGLLTHPHTSAGRLPTEEGYRYFVDNLMHEIQLLEEEKRRIKSEYQKNVSELETILEKTSEVMSEVTHYTSIISVDGWQGKLICRGTSLVAGYPEFHDFNKIREILSMLEEKERILEIINRELKTKIKIYIGQETAFSKIENCSLAVSSFKKPNGPSGRIAVLGPTRMDYERVVSALGYISGLMNELL